MAKIDKDFSLRMWGMQHALEVAKKDGIEGLEREIKMRGVIKAPFCYTNDQIDRFWEQLSRNLYNTTMTVMGMSLHERFGFGKKRLQELKDTFDQKTKEATDLSWIGNHYVTLEDYAVYLNEKFDLGINTEVVAVCQDSYDEKDKRIRMANVEMMMEKLKEAGFEDAAEYIDRNIG